MKHKHLVEVDLTNKIPNLNYYSLKGNDVIKIDELIKELTTVKSEGFSELTIKLDIEDNSLWGAKITSLRPETKEEKDKRLTKDKQVKKAKEALNKKLEEQEYMKYLILKKKYENNDKSKVQS